MDSEQQLRAKLRKIEALFAGAKTPGERSAAGAAMERIRARLAEASRRDAGTEMRFRIADPWSRQLFLALVRRYGLDPYRLPRQHRSTVMLRAPKAFVQDVLWPEFEALNEALVAYLSAVTARIIRNEVHKDTGDAREWAGPR